MQSAARCGKLDRMSSPTPLDAGDRERRLYLLMTRAMCRAAPEVTLRTALEGGVDLVQLREKPFRSEDEAWIRDAARLCSEFGVPCIINDALEFASLADGLHLGQGDLAPFEAGALRARGDLLGISTHDLEELARAMHEEPDYIGVGPCFPTSTKGYERGLSDDELCELVEAAAATPAFAIGGITAERLPRLLDCGVRRVAVSSVVLGASDPKGVSAELRQILDSADPKPRSKSRES